MAETKEGEQDQSMEEILQSIKRIIAEEGDAAGENPEDAASDVLELTEIVEESSPAPNLATAADPFDALFKEESVPESEPEATIAAPELATTKEPEPLIEDVPAPVIAKAPEPEPVIQDVPAPVVPEVAPALQSTTQAESMEDENLLSEQALRASAEALRGLAGIGASAATGKQAAPLGFRSGQTVEDVVIEAIRPMLKEWLDSNLPAIVMRKVQHEVERISHELREV
jgi:uncharacterized protein